jgi:prolyl-tRNA synthetase
MAKKQKTAITPTRAEDYPEWYQQVVKAADMAETSAVRGCMVIKPWGYAIWELIQKGLDGMFKETGHVNAYFPLFIPLSFLEKEAEHVEGFAKECAVVTHHRLEKGPDGGLIPAGELDEPLIVRPTSETIIGATFAKWVQSYRDLPLLINQWANVVRWEMRTRLFLRTSEFLWQEGHTVHATEQEAIDETEMILNLYAEFCRDYMAMPVLTGIKTESEKFPGAVKTYCIEGMMQDKKALQAGTSHFLGQNFAKASDIKFLDDQGQQQYGWTTSWGVSTRLIGGLIMTHSDDNGLVLPPRLAPSHIVILPVLHKDGDHDAVLDYCESLAKDLKHQFYADEPIRVQIDKRDIRGGEKSWGWVKKGVPLRIEVGPRDIADNKVFGARRDEEGKFSMDRHEFVEKAASLLEEIQEGLLSRATKLRDENTFEIDSKEEFYRFFKEEAGFVKAHWNGSAEVEEKIKNDLNVTIRCIPLDNDSEEGICIFTGEKCTRRVIFGKSY